MSVPRLFHCTVAGLVVATGLSFLFGASGLYNYRDLRVYETHVADAIAALQDRHRRLHQRAAVLRDNPEALRLLARESGYYRPGETVIELGPVAVDPTAAAGARTGHQFADVAPLLQHTPPAPRDPFNALALGLFLGVGSFAGLSMMRVLRRRQAQPDAPAQRAGDAGAISPRTGTKTAAGAISPRTGTKTVAGAMPSPTGTETAAGLMPPPARSDTAAGNSPAPDDGATPAPSAAEPDEQPAGRRRKARRRPRDVTVYRL